MGAPLFKEDSVSKLIICGLVLIGIGIFSGWWPALTKESDSHAVAESDLQKASHVDPPNLTSSAFSDYDNSESVACTSMSSREREKLRDEAGLDLASFIEQSTKQLHHAKSSEDQLKVIATNFDHQNWFRAWIQNALRKDGDLSSATLFLTRYHRMLENGIRQEASALRAFQWSDEVKREIDETPLRALVRGYSMHTCLSEDQSRYGCERGESLFRVRVLLSPHVACRFPEKRELYAATFWVRIEPNAPTGKSTSKIAAKIVEVEVNGERLAMSTSDEIKHRELLSTMAPPLADILVSAGLDPSRVPKLWREWVAAKK